MHESQDKSTHRLPMPLSKIKHGDADDMEAKDVEEEQEKEDLEDDIKADEAPIRPTVDIGAVR